MDDKSIVKPIKETRLESKLPVDGLLFGKRAEFKNA